MSKFDRKKIAVTLAFASLFGSKTSAINLNKTQVKSAQNFGAVSNNNPNFYSNPMPYPRMLEKPRGMSNLAKVGIAVGSILGTVFLANEGLGAFTDAETWYKGEFSFANGIKYLSAPTPEQRIALYNKIRGVLESFGDIKNISNKAVLTSEESSRIAIETNCGDTKLGAVRCACNRFGLFMAGLGCSESRDAVDKSNKLNKQLGNGVKIINIANGAVTVKDGVIRRRVRYSIDSVVVDIFEKNQEGRLVYTMNEDGSLTLEAITANENTKATFYMPGQESAGKEAPKIRNPEVQTSMPKSVPEQRNSGQRMPGMAGLNNDMKMFVPTSGQGNSGRGMPGMAGLNNDMKMFVPTSGQGDSRQGMQQMAKFGNEVRMLNDFFGMFNMG